MHYLALTFPKKQFFFDQKDVIRTGSSPEMTNLPALSGIRWYRVVPASRKYFQPNRRQRQEIAAECHS